MAKAEKKTPATIQYPDPGLKPTMAWLALDKLVVDQSYQRNINKDGATHVGRIARSFSWRKFQPLTVAALKEPKGKFAVLDGQHRLEAARRHPGVSDVPCYIVVADEVSVQALTFVAVNKDRIKVNRLHIFWASLAAGDAEAVRIKTLCDRAKVKIARGAAPAVQLPPRTTIATGAIAKLLLFGDAVVVDGLKVLAEAQGEVAGAFRACNIVAVVKLMEAHKDRLDRARLVDVLGGLDLEDEIEKARGYRKMVGGSLEAGLQLAITRAYNKGVLGGKRLPEKAEDRQAA